MSPIPTVPDPGCTSPLALYPEPDTPPSDEEPSQAGAPARGARARVDLLMMLAAIPVAGLGALSGALVVLLAAGTLFVVV